MSINDNLGNILTSLDGYDHEDLLLVAKTILKKLNLTNKSINSESENELRILLKKAVLEVKTNPEVLFKINKICEDYELKSLKEMRW